MEKGDSKGGRVVNKKIQSDAGNLWDLATGRKAKTNGRVSQRSNTTEKG